MNNKEFSKVQIGQEVELAVDCHTDGYFYIKAGVKGVVGVANVPSVTREGVYFHCVDFPHDTPVYNLRGDLIIRENKHKNKHRIGVLMGELK